MDKLNKCVRMVMSTAEYYDEYSDVYLSDYGPVFQAAMFAREPVDHCRVMMGRGVIFPGHSVLDVGCGVGGVMNGLMANGVEDLTGVTISRRQVELAELSLELADFMEWEDRGRRFDRLIFCESFGYFEEPGKLIEKCVGLLKPGGMIYVKDLCAVNDPDLLQQYGLAQMGKLWGGYRTYSVVEMAWMWGMGGMRRVGGADNLWRETAINQFMAFVRGEGAFAEAHREKLAEFGMGQHPVWEELGRQLQTTQLPVKASDFLFAM